MTLDRARIGALLQFWFGPPGTGPREVWFKRNDAFDATLRAHFLDDHLRAASGECDSWLSEASGALGLVLLLDQLPRNLFRGTARAFGTDPASRKVSRHALAAGFDRAVPAVQRLFFYLPFEHSEDLADQEQAIALIAAMPDHPEFSKVLRIARRHREIIARFGRFPHRNAALGRTTTPEEARFLQEPESAF